MNTTWIEIKKFLNNNIKNIIISSIILGTVFAGLIFFLSRSSEDISEEALEDEIEYPTAYFRYYVEREDGVSFTNTDIIKEYFTRNAFLVEMSNDLDLPLDQLLLEDGDSFIIVGDSEMEELEELEETENTILDLDKSYVALDITKASNSHIFTFTVTSANATRNLEIAEYFYSFVSNNEIPFYQNKNMLIFEEPQLLEDKFITDETMEDHTNNDEGNSVLISAITSYVLAIILATGFYILKSLFSNKLIYSFTYLWNEDQYFLLFNQSIDEKDKLIQFLSYPENKNKIYISENRPSSELQKLILSNDYSLDTDLPVYKSVTDVKLNTEVNEIIILVNEGDTSRKWYRKQQNLLSIYNNAFIKIVQLNK